MVKEGYDEMEKEALKAWNVDMLTRYFPTERRIFKRCIFPIVGDDTAR